MELILKEYSKASGYVVFVQIKFQKDSFEFIFVGKSRYEFVKYLDTLYTVIVAPFTLTVLQMSKWLLMRCVIFESR